MTSLSSRFPALDADRAPARRAQPQLAAALLAAAVIFGLAAGVSTCYAQRVLPGSWNQLANSGAVWTVLALIAALPCTRQRWTAVTSGGLALVAEVVGYYACASPLWGIPTSRSEWLMWTIAALWVGPAAGLTAWWIRRGGAGQRVIAELSVAGLVAGEGWYEIHNLGQVTFGRSEILVAVAVAGTALVAGGAGWSGRIVAVGAGGIVAATTFVVYAQTIMM